MTDKTKRETTRELRYWRDPEEHVAQLNEMTEKGFHVENIYMNFKSEPSGVKRNFTIYIQYNDKALPFLDWRVSLGDVYSILNKVFPEYEGPFKERSKEFDKLLKVRVGA